MKDFEEAYEMVQKKEDEMNYILGKYVLSALNATVGNMFKKETDKPNEYIKMPILQYDEDLIQEMEIKRQRKEFVQRLLDAKAEFDANKKLQEGSVS